MTECQASAAANNVVSFNDYKRKSPLKHRKDGFEGLMRSVKKLGVLSRPQRVLLGIICSACFGNGFFDKSKAWLCAEYQGSYQTICRILNQLEKMGFIETDGRGLTFRIFLTDLCYIDDIFELKKRYIEHLENDKKTDSRVLKNDKNNLKNENPTLISSKNVSKKNTDQGEKPPPDKPPKEPPTERSKTQPAVVLFSNNQIEKMGTHAKNICELCKNILTLASKTDTSFNPMLAVGKSLKANRQPGAIEETLMGIFNYWSTIDNPWRIYESQLKIKNQNYNAIEAQRMSDDYKRQLSATYERLNNAISGPQRIEPTT